MFQFPDIDIDLTRSIIEWARLPSSVKYLVIVTLFIQIFTMQFVPSFLFWGFIWSCLLTRIYLIYSTQDIMEWFETYFQQFMERLSTTIITSTNRVAVSLKEAGTTIRGDSWTNIAMNFQKHRIGIALCAKTVFQAKSTIPVVEEIGKVVSMLGLEDSLVNSAVGRLTSSLGQMITMPEPIEIQDRSLVDDIEKFIPLLASSASLTGLQINDAQFGTTMDKISRNIRSAKIITDQVKSVLQTAGVIRENNWQILEELNAQVLGLKKDHRWIQETLYVEASSFMTEANYARVMAYQAKADKLSQQIRSINLPEIKNNQIVIECNLILQKCNDYVAQVKAIRAKNGIRPTPVGVNLFGASQIGKSTLIPELFRRVKGILKRNHRDLFHKPEEWQMWNASPRDEFDSGYGGHEAVYMDDAWQDKTNKDHLMWYQWISPSCVGTVQGLVEQKGMPFRALLCFATSNTLPRNSLTVNTISALHERWPLTYKVSKVGWSADHDPQFSHLEFEGAKMTEWIAGGKEVTDKKTQKVIYDQTHFAKVSLDQMAEQIVERLVINMRHYNAKIQAMKTLDEQDDLIERSDEDEIEKLLSDISDTGEDYADENDFSEVEETFQLTEIIVNRNEKRLDYTTVNADVNISDEQLRNIALEINRALSRDEPNDLVNIGDWYKCLRMADKDGNMTIKCDLDDYESVFDFCSGLGAWHIVNEEEFNRLYKQQPILVLEDRLATTYLWGPAINQGRTIWLISDQMRYKIRQCLRPWLVRKAIGANRRAREIIISIVESEEFYRTLRIASIRIVGETLVPTWIPVVLAGQLRMMSANAYYTPYRRGYHPRDMIVNAAIFLNKPFNKINKGFSYLEKVAERLKDGMTGILLQSLEWLGIDVSEYWRGIADIASPFVTEALTIALAALLVYILYKLVSCFLNRNKKLEEHSKNEIGKAKMRGNKKQERMRVRQFQPRSDDCPDCKEEDHLVVIGEEQWNKVGAANQQASFYSTEYLDHARDSYCEGSPLELTVYHYHNSHVSYKVADSEDFGVSETKFHLAKRTELDFDGKSIFALEIKFDIQGEWTENLKQYKEYLEHFRSLVVANWEGTVLLKCVDRTKRLYFLKVHLLGLNTKIQGPVQAFTRRLLGNLTEKAENIQGIKISANTNVEEIVLHSGAETLGLVRSIVKNYQVYLSIVDDNALNLPIPGTRTYGLGHFDQIILNAHCVEEGMLCRFWRVQKDPEKFPEYQVCQVKSIDRVRDLAIANILTKEQVKKVLVQKKTNVSLSKMSSMHDRFQDLGKHLCDESTWLNLVNEQKALCYLPTTGFITSGRVKPIGPTNFRIRGVEQIRDFIQITELENYCEHVQVGDCGGIIVSDRNRYMSKIVGFHSGGTSNTWYATILRKEDLNYFKERGGYKDRWEGFILNGTPTDLPPGDEVEFCGKFMSKTAPAADMTLDHWHLSDFSEEFEEQLLPGPLNPLDRRIEVDLPTNQLGKKSLLLIPNGAMCQTLPDMDQELLDDIVTQMITEMTLKIWHINPVPTKMEQILKEGLNGHPYNQFVKGLDVTKACGLPWNQLKGCSKKSDFLDRNASGDVAFREGKHGEALLKRVQDKLEQAKIGNRILSFSNSKLKDAVIKLSAVKAGKTRVFHCIPVDKIIVDQALFGNFKEAYTKAGLNLNHAVGFNPHSCGWKMIQNHLSEHPNVFDVDFTNYDKYLHAQLLRAVFKIIRSVIQSKSPDVWDTARQVLETESIETYVVDYDTVYRTRRGNKSGEYLTTIVNCIANDILSFYAFAKITGETSMSVFRRNVSLVTFGDDKIESVSDDYAEQYNYLSVKECLEKIGHKITPGSKDGIEAKFCGWEQLQFLKRTFKEWDGILVAPLLQRSIESPFVWTQNDSSEYTIWVNLVEQQIYEAVLHGEDYYNEFVAKLGKCADEQLLKKIASMLATKYQDAVSSYRLKYFERNQHLSHDD